MSGLVLKLAPNERVLINGAVIENGARRGRLSILTPNANILRLRDAIHPEDANTPVRRLCYLLQLVLSGDKEVGGIDLQAINGIEALKHVFRDPKSSASLDHAIAHVRNADAYQALKSLRTLIPIEDKLLSMRPQ